MGHIWLCPYIKIVLTLSVLTKGFYCDLKSSDTEMLYGQTTPHEGFHIMVFADSVKCLSQSFCMQLIMHYTAMFCTDHHHALA